MSQKVDFSFLKGRHASPEGGRMTYTHFNYTIIKQYTEDHKDWPLRIIPGVGISREHKTNWFFFPKSDKEARDFLQKFIDNPLILKELENYTKTTREKSIREVKVNNLSSLNNKEISNKISTYYNSIKLLFKVASTLRYIDRAVMAELKKIVQKYNLEEDAISVLSTSQRRTFSVQEHLAILELAVKVNSEKIKDKEIDQNLKEIHKSYCFGVLGYYNEQPKSLSDYKREFETALASNPEKDIKSFKDKLNLSLNKRKALMKNLNKEEKLLADIAAESSYLKDYFKSSINELQYKTEPIFEEISRKKGRNIEFLKDLFPEEMLYLLNDKKLDEKSIEERTKSYLVIMTPDKFFTLTGKEAEDFEEKFIKIDNIDKKEFKGRVACKGFVRGKAKIILGTDDFHKFNKGDIIIATNTSPDFVPLMKKASAIIAEEGGLTAHASVVSREMGVPCIVGIHNATKIFKDNELIEVDANKGVVKKL
ncbi:MAG: PEP-utilizing enzyme [Nanoarchaeota archaeon]|nr:PEP-utilizing enzyme [Nanoarchaeota archaeon]